MPLIREKKRVLSADFSIKKHKGIRKAAERE